MNIPKEDLKIWKKELNSASIKKLAELYEMNPISIKRAIKAGKCHPNTYNAIQLYLHKVKFEQQEFRKLFKK